MKKVKSGPRRSSATSRPRRAEPRRPVSRRPPKNSNDYFLRVPESARSTFTALRAAIRSAVPADAVETISYGIPAFKSKGVLVWFAAFSDHCSLFPTASVIAAFRGELKNFSTSKGTVHFPLGKPLPTALIKRIVKARVAEFERKKTHS